MSLVDRDANGPRKLIEQIANAKNDPGTAAKAQEALNKMSKAPADADVVVITDVYGAGEPPVPGVTGKLIADFVCRSFPGRPVAYLPHRDELIAYLVRSTRPGDLLLTMGAGDVTSLGEELLLELRVAVLQFFHHAGELADLIFQLPQARDEFDDFDHESGRFLDGQIEEIRDNIPVYVDQAFNQVFEQFGPNLVEDLAQLGGRREVLVLGQHVDQGHPLGGGQAGDDALDQLLGGRRAGGDAHRSRKPFGNLGGRVHAVDRSTAFAPRDLLEGHRVRRVGRADHDDGRAAGNMLAHMPAD